MTIRPKKWEYCLDIAAVVAKRATCPRLAVGAVIVTPDYQIISTGYNGAPKGATHCADSRCEVDAADHCTRAVHAEANAIAQAACNGAATKDCYLFCTHQPCNRCLPLLVNAGIKLVVYRFGYKADLSLDLLSRFCDIEVRQWEAAQ